MDENSINQSENLLFPELFSLRPVERKRVEVSFTAPELSSQGGLLLLRELDLRLGLVSRLEGCRGTMELHIKEMKVYLSADRCSCSSFSANQFRLFLHAAA